MGTLAEVSVRGSGNGRPLGSSRSVIQSYAPATGELIGEAKITSNAEVLDAVARARTAQQAWGILTIEERCERLLRFKDGLVERAEELIELLASETGKPLSEALGHELFPLVDMISWYADRAPRALAPREISLHLLKQRRSVVHYVPRGVIGVIAPWNFPLLIPFGDAAAALVTGSAVVVKPSEVTPLIALKVKEIWDMSGLAEDLLQIVTGAAETGAALIDAGVNKIIFTGGVATGRKVAAACGERLIPCVMELGGKAPLIACDDADLERTARAITYAGFANGGQACVSVERVYAHRDIYDRLVSRVTELVSELRLGNGLKQAIDVGAIISPNTIAVAERHISDALAKGARLMIGGKSRSGAGQFFEPTVLADCTHDMSVMTEEIFGPIVPIMRVDSDAHALELANDSHLGLNAYIFTEDRDKGRRMAERVEAGSVLVNDVLTNYICPETPFGGIKQSGFGRVHGEDALRDLADIRHVSVNRFRMPARDPFWFPYGDKSYQWALRALRTFYSSRSLLTRIRKFL